MWRPTAAIGDPPPLLFTLLPEAGSLTGWSSLASRMAPQNPCQRLLRGEITNWPLQAPVIYIVSGHQNCGPRVSTWQTLGARSCHSSPFRLLLYFSSSLTLSCLKLLCFVFISYIHITVYAFLNWAILFFNFFMFLFSCPS